MFCKNCGQQIQDTALFCNFCGHKQDAMINDNFDMDKTVSVFDEQPGEFVPPVPVVTEPVIQPPMPQPVQRPFGASNKDFDPDATVGLYGDMPLPVPQYTPVEEPKFEAPQYTPVEEPKFEAPQYTPVEEPKFEAPQYTPVEEPKFEAPQYTPVEEPKFEVPQYTPVEEPKFEVPQYTPVEEPKFAPQPAVQQFTPAAPVYNAAQVQNFDNNVKKEKKGFSLFKMFGKKEQKPAVNAPVAPIPPVVQPTYVEPATQPVVQPEVTEEPTPVTAPVVTEDVKAAVKVPVTDKDIYDMAQNHAPFDVDSQEAQQMFREVLMVIVPAYKDGVKLETAMLSTAPADIKINIANADTDTLLVAIKALNYHLSVGCDPAVLGLVIQRIYKVLRGRLS